MKRQLPFFSALAILLVFGTTSSAQVKFGVKAGLNLANISADNELLGGTSPKMLPSFHAGFLAEFGISENLGVGAGLQISGKGFKVSESDGGDKYEVTSRPLYLQVPVSLNYTNNGFFAGVGPYIGFGIGGKNKESLNGDSAKTDINFGDGSGSGDDTYASLDYGIGLELGYLISGNIRLSASYNFGLANALPKEYREDEFGKYKINHKVIGISATYLFGAQ